MNDPAQHSSYSITKALEAATKHPFFATVSTLAVVIAGAVTVTTWFHNQLLEIERGKHDLRIEQLETEMSKTRIPLLEEEINTLNAEKEELVRQLREAITKTRSDLPQDEDAETMLLKEQLALAADENKDLKNKLETLNKAIRRGEIKIRDIPVSANSAVLYFFGFFFLPRITLLFIFQNHVTSGFDPYNLALPITIWLKYAALGLSAFAMSLFSVAWLLAPRLMLGVIAYQYVAPGWEMIVLCAVGAIIDIWTKFVLFLEI